MLVGSAVGLSGSRSGESVSGTGDDELVDELAYELDDVEMDSVLGDPAPGVNDGARCSVTGTSVELEVEKSTLDVVVDEVDEVGGGTGIQPGR